MKFGFPWSEAFAQQLSDKEFRAEFVADQVRTRIALLIRALREQFGLSQAQLGELMGKPQSVISRLENPDYGKESLQTLLDVAAAFGLPLLVDIPQWDEWLDAMRRMTKNDFNRSTFEQFCEQAKARREEIAHGGEKVISIGKNRSPAATGSSGTVDLIKLTAMNNGQPEAKPLAMAL